jgi:hypothetical protein
MYIEHAIPPRRIVFRKIHMNETALAAETHMSALTHDYFARWLEL